MSFFNTILVEKPIEGVTSITLNRPHRLNALNSTLLRELCIALRDNAQSRVIVLTGAGDRSFCSGEDLQEGLAPATGSRDELRLAFDRLQDLTRLTSMSSALIISAVQGYAVGGGAEIALGCDFVIGGRNTVFRFPEVPIGHAATGGITARLTSIVGLLKAKELLIRGRFINAEEALRIGLLTELVASPKDRALELAGELAALPRVSASQSKMSLERGTFPNMEAVLQDEINTASVCFAEADSSNAFSDFASRKSRKNLTLKETSSASTSVLNHPAIRRQIIDLNTAIDAAAKEYAEHVFLRFTSPLRELSYAQFRQQTMKLAAGLHAVGIGAGDRIMMMMQTSPEAVQIWFAANRIGAVWVPINTELKSVSLQHAVQAAKPRLAIVGADYYSLVLATGIISATAIYVSSLTESESTTPVKHLEHLYLDPADSRGLSNHITHPSETAALLFTSGTTGRSKACVLSHSYFIHAARNLSRAFNFTSTDVLYCPYPLYHGDATSLTIIPALLLGATAALSPGFSVSKFWDEIRETKATVYDFMGATLGFLWKALSTEKDRQHNVRLAWGVPIPSWATSYEERFGHKIVEVYGSTETGLPVAQPSDHPRLVGSCGRLIPGCGYTIRVADDFDEPVDPPTKVGHLLFRSDVPHALFDGYFEADQETAKAFRGTWFHTGDLAKIDERGNLFFMGRTKDAIRRRGEMVSAFLVEEEILVNAAVKICAAVGVPSRLGDGAEEEVKVVVVKNEVELAGRDLTEKGLWEWCRTTMPRFMVPDYIEIVTDAEIEITETGKISKKGLKKEVESAMSFDMRADEGTRT